MGNEPVLTRRKRPFYHPQLQTVYTVVELTLMSGLVDDNGSPNYLRVRRYLRKRGVILHRHGKNLICYLSDIRMKVPDFWDSCVERATYAHLLRGR